MAKKLPISAEFTASDKVSGTIKSIEQRLKGFSIRSVRSMDKMDKKTNNIVKGFIGYKVAATGVGAVAGALKKTTGLVVGQAASVLSLGMAYEKSLDTAAAKFGGIRKGTDAYKQLTKTAEQVGDATEFSAIQAGKGLEFLAMAGFSATQATANLPKVVDLATAANVDLARATDIASDTLGAFGLMAKGMSTEQLSKNLQRVNDVMAKTATTSNTTLEAMFETFKEAGPIGKTYGASIESVAALTGTMANAGIKGSAAGTTLKNIFVRLAAPTKAVSKVFKKLGVQTKDKSGKLRDVVSVLGELEKGLGKLKSGERVEVLNKIFGKIPLAGVNVLLRTGAKNIDIYRKKLQQADGASAKMAAQIRGNVAGSMATLKSKIDGLKLKFFKALVPVMHKIMPQLINAAKVVGDWVTNNNALISSTILETLKTMWDLLKGIAKTIRTIVKGVRLVVKGAKMAGGVFSGGMESEHLDKLAKHVEKRKQLLKQNKEFATITIPTITENVQKAIMFDTMKRLMATQQKVTQQVTGVKPEKIQKEAAVQTSTTQTINRNTQQQVEKTAKVDITIKAPKDTVVKKTGKAVGKFDLRTGIQTPVGVR